MADTKKIELYLPDGDPTGCLICDAANWDGKIFKIPKSLLSRYSNRPELQYTGLYFLIGGDDKPQIYIGEAENLYRRLAQHLEEDFWSECLVIVKKENSINKAHAKYLENFFYQLAKATGRCVLKNNCTPTKSSISEADEAVMDDFGLKVRDVISAIGYRFLTPIVSVGTKFIINPTKNNPQMNAKGMLTNEGFVVIKGSTTAQKFSSASSKSLKAKWDELRARGMVKNNKFIADYLTSAPSTAAAMVLGRNANGLTEWKTPDGRCLKDYLEENKH